MIDTPSLLRDVEGWCTLHKAEKLAELAASPSVRIAVELGVYGGKSLLPVAAAFKAKGFGIVYGIEPWDNDVAVEISAGDDDDKWWRGIDLGAIKRGFLQNMGAQNLEAQIKILEIPSDSALTVFQGARFYGKVDLLHLDGALAFESRVFDVSSWFGVCAKGAHIVLENINWKSVALPYEFLNTAADMAYSVSDESLGHFAIFKKR